MIKLYINTKVEGKLKESVLLYFNANVSTTNDAIRLSESIYKKTKKSINYNTIRRLFNVVPSISKPSLFTLNTLAEYVGKISWENFCTEVFTNERLIMHDFNIISSVVPKIDFDKLEKEFIKINKWLFE